MLTFTVLRYIRRVLENVIEMTGRLREPYRVIVMVLVILFDIGLIILVIRLVEYDIYMVTH
jgi:hypothetical protein